MSDGRREFVQQPPFASVTFPESVARFIKQCQMERFNGKIILHMHEGEVGAVEPQHAPMNIERLTAKLAQR